MAWRSLADQGSSADPEITHTGTCARCRVITDLTPLRATLSENFTGWGSVDPAGEGLCESCAWGFREAVLRTRPVVVHRDWGALWASRLEVTQCLSFALTDEVAVSLPVDGRKHLLPHAEWACVVSDDGPLVWGQAQASLVTLVAELRQAGIRENEFVEPVPPFRVVSLVMSDTAATLDLMARWELLRPWQSGPHLGVAVRATRPSPAGDAPSSPGAEAPTGPGGADE